MNKPGKQSGYTAIELIITLFILGSITATAVVAWVIIHFIAKFW